MTNDREGVRLAKSAFIVFLASCIRWFLGCIRIVIIAFLFGAAFAYDAYLAAFAIPEMAAGLLVGVIAVSFVPIFTDSLFKEGEAGAWDFASNLIIFIFIAGISLTVLTMALAPFIVRMVAPGFNEETFRLAVRLSVIISSFILIAGLAEVFRRMLHTYQRFIIPALSRVLEVAIVIVSLIFLSSRYGIFSLAFGILLGALAELLFQMLFLRTKFKYYRFGINLHLPALKKVILLAGPLISCMLFLRIGTVIERLLASTLKEGSISVLGYAAALSEVPAELFIGSLGVVLFPLISRYAAEGNMKDFKAVLSKGIRIGNFVLVPIAVLFIFFGKEIVRSLLERGRFISVAAHDTSIALAIYALSMFAIAVYFFAAHACYAIQEVRATLKIAVLAMALNIILKLALINYLSFAGLALATSIALIIQSALLLAFVRKKIGPIGGKGIASSFLGVLGASVLMAGTCWLVMALIPHDSPGLTRLAALIVTAGISYLVFNHLLRNQELTAVKDLLKKGITLAQS